VLQDYQEVSGFAKDKIFFFTKGLPKFHYFPTRGHVPSNTPRMSQVYIFLSYSILCRLGMEIQSFHPYFWAKSIAFMRQ